LSVGFASTKPVSKYFKLDLIPVISLYFLFPFIIALIPLLFISIPLVEKEKDKEEIPFIQEFKEGFSLLKTTPGFLVLAIWSLIANFLLVPFNILLSFFVNVTHSGTEVSFAVIMAFMQAGSITGALIISLKKVWKRKVLILMACGAGTNVGLLIAAFAPLGQFFVMGIGEFIIGFTLSAGLPIYFTILQTAVSPDKQGRIFSIDATFSFAIMPIGMIVAGPLANFLGIINFFVILGISGIIFNVLIYFFTNLRHLKY